MRKIMSVIMFNAQILDAKNNFALDVHANAPRPWLTAIIITDQIVEIFSNMMI